MGKQMELKSQSCVPCSGKLPPAANEEIAKMQQQIPQWQVKENQGTKYIERTYSFPDFKEAIAYTDAVGEIAEAEGHHPLLTTEWGKVTVAWWTHAINGLHQNDFVMAAKCDSLFTEHQ